MAEDIYKKLIDLLEQHGAHYRLIDHPPEGRTEVVSPMRGNNLRDAAKCMILMVKLGKKTTKYVLAIVPGDRRVSLLAVKALFGATYVSFASAEIAERLAGSVAGTILPFVLNGQSELELVADPSVGEANELFFNAARLDRSVALKAGPRVDVRACGTSQRLSRAAHAGRNRHPRISLLLSILSSRIYPFQEIRLRHSPASHGAECPIERLPSP